MSTTNVRSVEEIRNDFPSLTRRVDDIPVAYFDGPGGTQVPRVVGEAMVDYLYHHNANTHWEYPSSAETDAALADARRAFADFFGSEPEEVVFGANMTTVSFHVARALGRAWGPGDEIVVTELDHHGNVAPWEAVARERGVTLCRVPFRLSDGRLDMGALERAISNRTKLVALGAASNALGSINDIAAGVTWARAAGALSYIDAVHYAPHEPLDVKVLGCDFLVCSPYKFYGPHLGALYGRRELLEALDVPKLRPAPNTAPDRMETGTQNHEGIVGAAAAVKYLAALSPGLPRRQALRGTFRALHQRSERLFESMWDGLGAIPSLVRYGPHPGTPRTPTLAFTVPGFLSSTIARGLAERGIFVSHGDFYAATVIERYGLGEEGVVRAGCACYTTADEVERLVVGVREIVG